MLRKIGKSDLLLSPVGLGSWQFSKGIGIGNRWKTLTNETITDIIKVSIENGTNWIDTAEAYGWGESERTIRKALASLGKTVIIADKWFPHFRTAKNIIKTIDERLSALGVEQIELYQVHNDKSFSSIPEVMKRMAELVFIGKIRYIGVSNFSTKQMQLAHNELDKLGLPLISNQIYYNMNNRKCEIDGTLELAEALNISIIAYSPLDQGKLKSPAAINWLIDRGVFTIVGCSSVKQARENFV